MVLPLLHLGLVSGLCLHTSISCSSSKFLSAWIRVLTTFVSAFPDRVLDKQGWFNDIQVWGDLPNKTSARIPPVTLCCMSLYFNKDFAIFISRLSVPLLFFSDLFTNFTRFSAVPLEARWYGGTLQWSILFSSTNNLNSEWKGEGLSDTKITGNPWIVPTT